MQLLYLGKRPVLDKLADLDNKILAKNLIFKTEDNVPAGKL
jgi:hypothetical protein